MKKQSLSGRRDLPGGLSIRPCRDSIADKKFVEQLIKDNRDDIRAADGDPDYLESIVDMQEQAMQTGYGNTFANAAHFIIEKLGVRVGRLLVESGGTEVRIVDLQFIPAVHDLGYGPTVIGTMQQAAAAQRVQLAITVLSNRPHLKQWLAMKGFVVEESEPHADRMIWKPTAADMGGKRVFMPS
ncbi:MAG: GNAT family N-acetyltransferase [Rhodospirillales bacterium]|nr:GNAT family N-acetyltransferase [Rhodospirillales bacterium]